MKELLEAMFSPVNIIPTGLLLLVLVYWITVFLGALDMDFLNFELEAGDLDVDVDVDVDADMDANADLDADADAQTSADISFLNSILVFFNLGRIPFMVFMSFLVFPMWFISILVNHALGNGSFLFSLLLLIPNFILSLFISKLLTTPIAVLFKKITDNEDDNFEYSGKMCTVLFTTTPEKISQAEINHNGNNYRINVICSKGTSINKGETALVIDYIKEKKCYLIEPYKK